MEKRLLTSKETLEHLCQTRPLVLSDDKTAFFASLLGLGLYAGYSLVTNQSDGAFLATALMATHPAESTFSTRHVLPPHQAVYFDGRLGLLIFWLVSMVLR